MWWLLWLLPAVLWLLTVLRSLLTILRRLLTVLRNLLTVLGRLLTITGLRPPVLRAVWTWLLRRIGHQKLPSSECAPV